MNTEVAVKQGRMEQSIDSLNEWIHKCDPSTDMDLLTILQHKLNTLMKKIKYIQDNHL